MDTGATGTRGGSDNLLSYHEFLRFLRRDATPGAQSCDALVSEMQRSDVRDVTRVPIPELI